MKGKKEKGEEDRPREGVRGEGERERAGEEEEGERRDSLKEASVVDLDFE